MVKKDSFKLRKIWLTIILSFSLIITPVIVGAEEISQVRTENGQNTEQDLRLQDEVTEAEIALEEAKHAYEEAELEVNTCKNALKELQLQFTEAEIELASAEVTFSAAEGKLVAAKAEVAKYSEGSAEYDAAVKKYNDAKADADAAKATLKTDEQLKKEEQCVIGDANSDGKVNVKDAVLALQYANKKIGANKLNLVTSDVNGDGKVNVKDAVMILQYANKKIDEFPANIPNTNPTEHNHEWEAVYKKVTKYRTESYQIYYMACGTCGADITGFEDTHIEQHMLYGENGSCYEASRTEIKQVLYTEDVLDYYKCYCGETK